MYTEKVIEELELDPSTVLKKKIRGLNGITVYALINSLLNTNTIKEAALMLGYSIGPVKDCIQLVLHPIFKDKPAKLGAQQPWKSLLLETIQLKECYSCKKILNIAEYHSNRSRFNGIDSQCRYCSIAKSKLRKYYIAERTPIWADLDAIEHIYANCPKGYHVDHIIPLRGKVVSGLHVPNNLQYLSSSQNLEKSNKFTVL
jgi:5-methylcytosine-specific restriction endonuclease McrA